MVSRASGAHTSPSTRTARPGTRERVSGDESLGHLHQEPELANLVFEEHAEGFDELESELFGKASDVVVRLDGVRVFLVLPGGGQDSMTSGYKVPWTKNLGRRPSSSQLRSCTP